MTHELLNPLMLVLEDLPSLQSWCTSPAGWLTFIFTLLFAVTLIRIKRNYTCMCQRVCTTDAVLEAACVYDTKIGTIILLCSCEELLTLSPCHLPCHIADSA